MSASGFRSICVYFLSRSMILLFGVWCLPIESAVSQIAPVAKQIPERLWNQEGYDKPPLYVTFESKEILDGDLLFLRYKSKNPHAGGFPRAFLDTIPPLYLHSLLDPRFSTVEITADGYHTTLLRVPLFVDRGGDENRFAIRVYNEVRESGQDPPLHVFQVVGTAMSKETEERIFRVSNSSGIITTLNNLQIMVSDADKLRPLIEELHPKSNIISYFQFAIDVHDMVIKPDRDPVTVTKELFRMANQLPDGLREYVLTMLPNFIKAESAEYRSRQLKKPMKRPSITS